jgi:hypothetical protein
MVGYCMRSTVTRVLFVLAVPFACVGMPSCSRSVSQYPYQAELVDAGTGVPAVGVDVFVDTVRPGDYDGAPLEGQALQDALERLLTEPDPWYYSESPVVRTDGAGEFAYHVNVFGYSGEQATGIPGCTSPFGPPVLVERVWVYAKIDGVWRQIEVPLTEADQSEVLASDYYPAGVRQIVLPVIYVTANGLSLTAGQG